MLPCQSLPSMPSGELTGILHTTASSRRLGRRELQYKRRVSRRLSHQLSVDSDIAVAGCDLREKVRQENGLIKTCTYLDRSYEVSFKGEELLHWMVANCWAAHAVEAISIAQLLLTHNVLVNVSDSRNLMTFKKFAVYRFRDDQEQIPAESSTSDKLEANFDMLYRKMWSDWVIRSRVIGWWLYTNTLTGDEFLSWLTSSKVTSSREEAHHFANQLFIVNFLIRIYPQVTKEKGVDFTDDDTIYQVNVCCNQSVDTTTKVFHTLAHAVRLCSVDSEDCMFYGKSDVPDTIQLQNFEMEDSADNSLASTVEEEAGEDAKRFLRSVCRAYYPDFTSAIQDTYYSYQSEPDDPLKEFSIPDEMFHSYQLSTFDEEDSIVIEFESGLDLQDMSFKHSDPLRGLEGYQSSDPLAALEAPPDNGEWCSHFKERSCTLDLIPTPRDSSLLFEKTKLLINYEDITCHK